MFHFKIFEKKAKHKATTGVNFEDIIGIEEYKDEIIDIVRYLKNPAQYKEMGAEIPKGIMLAGPPGTGKTMLAKALANEAGCSFFYISGAEIDGIFYGLGAKKIRELFAKARASKPAVIFIDEIDSVAMDRKKYTNIIEDNSTINQLLVEMDGFKGNDQVIVIGATNMVEKIDKALMRPGRFDKTVTVPLPDVKGREKVLLL